MINQFIIQGRLCAEPKEKFDSNGKPYIAFDMAVGRNVRLNNVLYFDFVNCRAKGRLAEIFLASVRTGQEVVLQGSIKTKCRKSPEGLRLRTEQFLLVEHVYFSRAKTYVKNIDRESLEEITIENADGIGEDGLIPEEAEEEVVE
jgi:single-stranded DNA-binding protein